MNTGQNYITIDKLEFEKPAKIKEIKKYDTVIYRLMEMGLIQEEMVKAIKDAPLGDPLEIEVMGYKVCIRKKELSNFYVEEVMYESFK